jgi:hypothetical protein
MFVSSGDSTNKDIAYQKKQYDDAINRKAKNVLSLQHDVKSTSRIMLRYASSLDNFFFVFDSGLRSYRVTICDSEITGCWI